MKRILTLGIVLLSVAVAAFAATPNQANVNNLQFIGVDSSTGNAAAPFVDHSTGSMSVTFSAASASASVTVSGVVSTQNSTGSYTDHSGTITSGGVAQTVMAANTNRHTMFVHNPPTATENLYVDFGTSASASSVAIVPGAMFTENGTVVTTQSVSVFAATTGHAFVAKEM